MVSISGFIVLLSDIFIGAMTKCQGTLKNVVLKQGYLETC